MDLSHEEFRKQAEFRFRVRSFLASSELNSRRAGLDPNQFQLLLAVKGLPCTLEPNVSTLARRLMIEGNSAVELVDRCVKKGLAERFTGGKDKRHVFVRLTDLGHDLVEKVALQNRQEIIAALPAFLEFLSGLK